MNIKNSPEYIAIKEFYGDNKAKRSQVPLINHINEGLVILEHLQSTDDAKKAYCLHPLFQNDSELTTVGKSYAAKNLSSNWIMILVMEYRARANDFLSGALDPGQQGRYKSDPSSGSLEEVRHMLIADKVQNNMDFRIHHLGTHPNSNRLEVYFDCWLEALGIDKSLKERLEEEIIKYRNMPR